MALQKTTLSLKKKLEIIDGLQSTENMNFAETARDYGVSRSQISRIWKNRLRLRSEAEEVNNHSVKRKRSFKEEDVDRALKIWFDQKIHQNARIGGPMLKAKAEQLAAEMGHDFVPSDGWLSRFKQRYGISYKKEHGEKQTTEAGAESWRGKQLQELLKQFSPDDVYNADETALFFRGLPDRGFVYKDIKLSGGKRQKDRLTVLVCANMSGTDKRKLLVIGKSKQPRGFPSDLSKLPVIYKNSTNAWMTSDIFADHIKKWDKSLRLQGRSILLLVDNCTAHPKIQDLSSIRLEYLPPNTTATLQPMDQGIIRALKYHYRYTLNNSIIAELDASENKKVEEIIPSITVLRAIYLVFDAWLKVSDKTIRNCYRKAGFSVSCEDDTGDCEIPGGPAFYDDSFPPPPNMDSETFHDFVDQDSDVPVTEELTDCEIIESVLESKRLRQEEEAAEDDVELLPVMPSAAELMNSLHNIRIFMDMNGMTSQTKFETITKSVQNHVSSSKKQCTITQFFNKQ